MIVSQEYNPFGKILYSYNNGTGGDRFKFTGKEYDTETGLNYHGARHYNFGTYMWNSVDPLAEKYPGWSPYNCCSYNPIANIDLNCMAHYYYDKYGKPVQAPIERSFLHNLFFGDKYYVEGSENATHTFKGVNYCEIEKVAVKMVEEGDFQLFENGEQLVDVFMQINKTSGVFPINIGEVLEKSPVGQTWDSKQDLPKKGIYIFNGTGYMKDVIGNIIWGNIMANTLWPSVLSTAGAGIIHNIDNGFSLSRFLKNPIGLGDDPRDTNAILMGYLRAFGAYK